ncbi:cellulose binding domain-containing protein [Actinocorallia sp. A-T 12471]|uniref:cellulose binding domain-containing protein n=1 Tax=Actinocorallia sp. A-T 12471 TaxID=3089813 RepID=UPI0029D25C0D|nr:cellulose binding domain-containing protein [Actinocorallia sp. A-T 12471]MDX6739089.1 cellulose binding domain-containing protein [Actinocorallia sp. A-T 12471]
MGRHTKFWDRPVHTTEPPAPSPAKKVRMAWIGRTPLMPVLAGVGAIGVITAAFLTQDIALNFAAPPDSARQESAACAGCEPLRADLQTPGTAQAAVPGGESERSVVPPGLRATFRLDKTTGSGFAAYVTLRNTDDKAIAAWKVRFRLPNAVVHGAEGATVQTVAANGGTTVLSGTTPIGAGETLRVRFTGEGAWSNPTGCRVNGLKCR